VIGTRATINSNAYAHAIRLLDPEVEVISYECPLFVPLAEEGWIEHKVTGLVAKEYLFPLKQQRIDTLILGCTHYPLLRPTIQAVLESSVTLIDSGEATAATVEQMIDHHGLRNPSKERANLQFYVSDIPAKFAEIGERFLGQKMGRVKRAEGF